ncbi:putative membrane protein YphA (DoxX/SURF4 family) [Rhodopseudomonas faecalis]|uniref:Putative membrane protein YphA (DoxX/SURF4 family) n=2 Tax=Rhodopseudomonas faecalis TaxID=99655 RepID=A0A318TFJ5_9BRAD|nr:putative membrane protein YphA (DoxX/SURF4 family) [Rhodopseudomonas faecalis]
MGSTMLAVISFGRFLFAVLFIVSGAFKLLDLTATSELMAKIAIPEFLTSYTTELETMAGMPMAKMLAIAAGATELLCGVMIGLNVGARYFALLLILYMVGMTYLQHPFWNQTGPEGANTLLHALKNISLIGALFIIVGIGRGPQPAAAAAAEPSFAEE